MKLVNLTFGVIAVFLLSCDVNLGTHPFLRETVVENLPRDTILVDNIVLNKDSVHIFFETGFDSVFVRVSVRDFNKERILTTNHSLGAAARVTVPMSSEQISILFDNSYEINLDTKGRRNMIDVNIEEHQVKVGFKNKAPVYY